LRHEQIETGSLRAPGKSGGSKGIQVGSARGESQYVSRQIGKIIVIPDHGSTVIFRPLLRKILRDMGVGIEEYEKILKEL